MKKLVKKVLVKYAAVAHHGQSKSLPVQYVLLFRPICHVLGSEPPRVSVPWGRLPLQSCQPFESASTEINLNHPDPTEFMAIPMNLLLGLH